MKIEIHVHVHDEFRAQQIAALSKSLSASTVKLKLAIAGYTKRPGTHSRSEEIVMSELTEKVEQLKNEVNDAKTVMGSATTLINGFNDRLKAAVEAAIAKGAPPETLTDITDITTALDDTGNALAAAVAANTPGEPEVQ